MSNESLIKAGKILEKKYTELEHKYAEVAEVLIKVNNANYDLHLQIDEANVRIELLEKALILACEELHIHSIDPCCDLENPSLHSSEEIKEYFVQKAGEEND